MKADLPGFRFVRSSHRLFSYTFYKSSGSESFGSGQIALVVADPKKEAYDWSFAKDMNGTCIVSLIFAQK